MIAPRYRTPVVSAFLVLGLAVTGCGAGSDSAIGETVATADSAPVTVEDVQPEERTTGRTTHQQTFLDDVAGFGFPTDMTADTIIEVGIGICQGIADGADDATILERIHPLTSAIAAQNADYDPSDLGRAILEASRTHLCD